MARRIRVAVIFGGRSSEHSISCVSAGSILEAIALTMEHHVRAMTAELGV